MTAERDTLRPYFADHGRTWRDNLYVYPVVSRRSGGLSIGVNLNPDKACNFDCLYCQVDRTVPPVVRKVDLKRLGVELDRTVNAAVTGELFTDPLFAGVPASHRRINDIAFSGDGEPTASPQFPGAVDLAIEARRRYGLDAMKIVLITDAAYLDRPAVRDALTRMDGANGEIWAKLDAGTEEYFQFVNRPNVPLQKILDNILEAARVRPIVIQSMWMNVHGAPPPDAEIDAFARRLIELRRAGAQIRLLQVYTIVRHTAESFVTPLDDASLDRVAVRIRTSIDVPIALYGA